MTRCRLTAVVLAATLGAGALAIVSALGPERANGSPEARSDVIPGSYVVVYKDSVSEVGLTTRAREDELGFDRDLLYRHALKGFSAELTPEQVSELRDDPKVALVSPNGRFEGTASEPLAPSEPTPPPGIRRILSATTTTVRQAGANVAVLDTGIQLNHPDLNAVAGTNCIAPATPPDDDNSHGTHVAGTIGAKNNGAGVTGVAPNTKLYAVKVLDSSNNGTLASLLCGVDWVTANHAADEIEVANMSLTGPAPVNPDDETCDDATDPLRIAICNSTDAGVRYVVAAGNGAQAFDGVTAQRPAAYPEVLTVTATADSNGLGGGGGPTMPCSPYTSVADDTVAPFSNWAATAAGAAHTIAAPGTCIESTVPGSSWDVKSGTSQAGPHVAGAIALCVEEAGVAGQCAGETPAETIAHMRTTADAYTAVHPTHGFTGDPNHSPTAGKYFGFMVLSPTAPDLIQVTNTNDAGAGSLRAAIVTANANADNSLIFFTPGLTGAIELATALPTLAEDVRIVGPGADRLRVERDSAAAPFGILVIASATNVVLSGLTIADGDTGAGISNHGDLTLRAVEVRDNDDDGVISDAGTLTVERTTVSDNEHRTGTGAAGILTLGGTTIIRSSTIAGNEVHAGAGASSAGGVATLSGSTTIGNSTIVGNISPSGGANVSSAPSLTSLQSTIVANPLGGGTNCAGTILSFNYNLESANSCGMGGSSDQTGTDPQLGSLGYNGGPTRTLLPATSSPAVDRGQTGFLSVDQRDVPRPADLPSRANPVGGDGTDVGAVELHPASLQVTNTNDSGAGSLREAITDANALSGLDVIDFAPGLTGTLNLGSALPSLTGNVEIDGPGLELLTVRRNTGGTYRVFTIPAGARAEISGLTISNGASTTGGGVRNDGRLMLERVAVSSNAATQFGGGVFNDGTLTVKTSTVTGNSAQIYGAGLAGDGGTLTVLDSTVSGNNAIAGMAGGYGVAGIYVHDGQLVMRTSTVTGNTTAATGDPYGAAVVVFSFNTLPPSVIADSTIAGNTHLGAGTANLGAFSTVPSVVESTIVANPLGGGVNCSGAAPAFPTVTVVSQGFNLESANTCGFSAPSDKTNANPQLGALADNGGPTKTMALPIASPAVDAGSSTSGPADQRGHARPADQPGTANAAGGNGSDIGAFELDALPAPPPPPATSATATPAPKKCKKGQKLKKGKCVKKKKKKH